MRGDRAQQAFTGLGGRHAARGPVEQPQAEPAFEFLERMAQRRLRHTQLLRCTGEAARAGNRQEGNQVADVLTTIHKHRL